MKLFKNRSDLVRVILTNDIPTPLDWVTRDNDKWWITDEWRVIVPSKINNIESSLQAINRKALSLDRLIQKIRDSKK